MHVGCIKLMHANEAAASAFAHACCEFADTVQQSDLHVRQDPSTTKLPCLTMAAVAAAGLFQHCGHSNVQGIG